MRILVIEDEQDLREDLVDGLQMSGYAVDSAEDGQLGWELLEVNRYDLLILDLNLPLLDGMEILRQVRQKDHDLRILILSARDAVEDRVEGLDCGANDYLIKPFHFAELLARIRGLLRRRFETEESLIICQAVSLNQNTRGVFVGGKALQLMPKEYGILEYLMLHADRFVSQEELLEHVWDENADPFTSSVRVYVSYLRRKLSEYPEGVDLIESAPSKGYMIRKERKG